MKSLFILLFLASLTSAAPDTLVAGLFNIIPYAYVEEQKVIGITAEIVEELQIESGIPIKTVLLPYKRMLEYLKAGKIDFGIFFLSEFSAGFSDALLPLYDLETIIVGNKSVKIKRYSDLKSLKMATPLGVNYNMGLDKDRELQNIIYVKDYKQAIMMLKLERIDAVISPKRILEYQMSLVDLRLEDFGTPYSLTVNTAWIQFSHLSGKKQYKPLLISTAQKLLESGKIEDIIEKYYYR